MHMGSHTEENSLGAGLCLSWTPLPDPEYFPEVCRAPLGKSTYIVNEMMQRMSEANGPQPEGHMHGVGSQCFQLRFAYISGWWARTVCT